MNTQEKVAIIGAGFSGAVIARQLAEKGIQTVIFEQRPHIAGNCFTGRDDDTGIMVHKYGPHIFHTDIHEVWEFVQKYGEFKPFVNSPKITVSGEVFSLPINLHTINQFFKKSMNPEEAKLFIEELAVKYDHEPRNFEEQALSMVGQRLYEAFFKHYTIKQWGIHPTELPSSILKRLPLRFNYNANYFNHPYQGIPIEGYTKIVERLLDHENIEVRLNTAFKKNKDIWKHLFYSGPLDAYFDYKLGHLTYRTLDFEEVRGTGDIQGNAVINYGDSEIKHTRVTEHKHFSPWEQHEKSICFREFSRKATKLDIPYYPVRMTCDKELLAKYITEAEAHPNITFIGRLGTYRYLDMDKTIKEALETSKAYINSPNSMPAFIHNPLS